MADTGGTDRGGGPADELGERAGAEKDAARQRAGEKKEELKAQAREKGEELQARAREKGQELKDRAEEMAAERKDQAADKVHAFARALRHAGDSLDEEGEGELARYGRQTADQIERMAERLDRRDVPGLMHDLEDGARRNPAAFAGGTFAAGLLLGRFLRSSRPEPEGDRGSSYTAGDAGERATGRTESERTYSTGEAVPLASPAGMQRDPFRAGGRAAGSAAGAREVR